MSAQVRGRLERLHARRGRRPALYAKHHYLTVAAFVLVVAVVAPEVMTERSDRYLTNLWLVYAIAGVGFYWMFGLAGRFAFSQTVMMAFGGYLTAWYLRTFDAGSSILAILVAVVGCGAVAAAIALLLRKAQGFYFAIGTLAVTQIGMDLFTKAESFTGPNGTVTSIAPIEVLGTRYLTDEELFWVFLGFLAAVLVVGAALERSAVRRDAIAARDNLLVASAAGVPSAAVQVSLYTLGSAVGGLAGSLTAQWNGVISTSSFGIELAIGIFLMLFLGGAHSMWGPVIGAASYVALPRLLSDAEQYSTLVYGALLLLVIMLLPRGIVGLLQSASTAVRRAGGRLRPAPAGEALPNPALVEVDVAPRD